MRRSPGANAIFSKSRSRRIGGLTDAYSCLVYTCTTSIPARRPVFVTATDATTVSRAPSEFFARCSVFAVDTTTALTNVVSSVDDALLQPGEVFHQIAPVFRVGDSP